VRYTSYDNLFIFCWRIYRTMRDFYRTVKKSLTVRELVNDTFPPMNEAANTILFKF
jgi:hypothetical protein